jgi:hypothetical protein
MTAHLDILTIPPSERTRRIGELEAVRADLREFPVDAEPYTEELRSVEAELLALLTAEE